MQLIIMRHGEAENRFCNDSERNLTNLGVVQSAQTGAWLAGKLDEVGLALASPFNRAQQTYNEVKRHLRVVSSETSGDITPSGDPQLVHDYIRVLCAEQNLNSMLVVSHMPLVSYLLDSFCQRHYSRLFATAEAVLLDYNVESDIASIEAISSQDLASAC